MQKKSLRIVAISDLHSSFPALVPEGDVLVVAGDLTLNGTSEQLYNFIAFLQVQKHEYKIVIAGNHDICLDQKGYNYLYNLRLRNKQQKVIPSEMIQLISRHCIYLQNSQCSIRGIKFYGSPYTPKYYQWAFNYIQSKANQIWDLIPHDTHILITHGPAYGINDLTTKNVSAGCPSLRDKISKLDVKLMIHGHIHEGFGKCFSGDTIFANVSYMKRNYKPRNDKIAVFEIYLESKLIQIIQ